MSLYPLKRAYPEREVFLYSDDEVLYAQNKKIKLKPFLEQLETSTDTLISCGGIHSHHALAVALECAQRGWECHLILRGYPLKNPLGVHLLLRLLEPRLYYLSPEEYRSNKDISMERLAKNLQQQGKFPVILPQGGTLPALLKENPVTENCLKEIIAYEKEYGFQFRHFFVILGTGGTFASFVHAKQKYNWPTKIIGIPALANSSYFEKLWAELPGQGIDWDVWSTPEWGAFGKITPSLARVIERLAQEEGFLFDPLYDGKIFATLEEVWKNGENISEPVLVYHSGGLLDIFSLRWRFSKN